MLYFTRPPCEQKKGKTMTTHNMAEAKTSRARMINKRVLPDIFFVPTQLLVTHAKGRNHSYYPDFCHVGKYLLVALVANPLCTLAQISSLQIVFTFVQFQGRTIPKKSHTLFYLVSTEPFFRRFLHRLQNWSLFVRPRRTCSALNFLPSQL